MPKVNFKQFAQALSVLGPAILSVAGIPPSVITLVVHGISVAESIPSASGPEKKAKVLDMVKTSLTVGDALVHPDVQDLDVDQIVATTSHGIDTVIDTIHAVANIPKKAGV